MVTHLSMKSINIYKYPIGILRVQPIGIIIFAAIMVTLGFQVLIQAVEQLIRNSPFEKMSDFQLIWLHAHLDELGREEWEGFPSGTKAAAVGGITTLIDMPLNSFPSTVSKETLQLKIDAAKGRIFVNVGFWEGLVPENAFNASILENLLNAGVLGLKSLMCPSGINDFPMTNASHIKEGISILAKWKRPLLVHAEKVQEIELNDGDNDPLSYSTYLKTTPPSWEEAAIRELLMVAKDTRIGGLAEGAHVHIVHLSDSRSSLELIKEAKSNGDSITVETCPHYLAFSAEEIPDGDTHFKSNGDSITIETCLWIVMENYENILKVCLVVLRLDCLM